MRSNALRRGMLAALCVVSPAMAPAQEAGELAVARGVLLQLQPRSFAENVEYCGYIGRMPDGRLTATEVTRGDAWGCLSRGDEDRFVDIVASFHTHAAYDRAADSEVPSVDDVMGDMQEQVNGYITTPGGRLWYVDWRSGIATQVCGLGCMGQDPDFVPGDGGVIAQSYSLQDLRRREGR